MFGFIPAIKINDNLKVDMLDARKEGNQVNFDLVRVVTKDEDGTELTTQFGIQGQSDHLAAALKARKEKSDEASNNVVEINETVVVKTA